MEDPPKRGFAKRVKDRIRNLFKRDQTDKEVEKIYIEMLLHAEGSSTRDWDSDWDSDWDRIAQENPAMQSYRQRLKYLQELLGKP